VKPIAKICGADVELGNFVVGRDRSLTTPGDAARALLAEIPGMAGHGTVLDAERSLARRPLCLADGDDVGRKFLASNGGCVYIDLDHLEICLPEVRSAWDHLASWHAMLRIARSAQESANDRLRDARIQVLVNNSDGLGASYGSHLDFLVARRTWDDMFARKLHPLLFLAAFEASSIVVTGQGKVGSENGAPAVRFQLSQRADFIETLTGPQTTFRRPLVNSRDEPLCGQGAPEACDDLARLHVICYDSNLSHVAHVLKVGGLQIVLAMIEAEHATSSLMLDDPVGAMRRWSHDATLRHRERLVDGRTVTAVELQRLFLTEARAFVHGGGCDGVVPRAQELLDLWDDTITKLESADFESLAGRLDWVLKLSVLQSVAESRGLAWESAEMKHLDHLFSSLDPDEGLFWAYERQGIVERRVTEDEVLSFMREPPRDTRARARATLLREADPRAVVEVNWDFVRLRTMLNGWTMSRRIDLPDPRVAAEAELSDDDWRPRVAMVN
jgi:proteasome accessory factor A